MTVRLAASRAEVEQAYDLAARVFGPGYYEARAHKQALLDGVEPLGRPADVVIALDRDEMVGIIRLVERVLRFGSDRFAVIGITSVAVHPRYQKRGVGSALMQAAMDEGRARACDVAVLFARRAVDGWYPRFGFSGVGQHVQLQVLGSPETPSRSAGSWTAGVQPRRLARYRAQYETTYRHVPGAFARSAEWWARLSDRIALRRGLEFLARQQGSRSSGYALLDGNRVVEAACEPGQAPMVAQALVAELRRRQEAAPVFALHPSHPITRWLFTANHTLSVRRSWDGGHMLAPLGASVARRLQSHGVHGTGARLDDVRAWPVWSPLDEF